VTGTHLSHPEILGLETEMLIVDWRDCIIRNFMIGTHQILLVCVNKEGRNEQGVFHMWGRGEVHSGFGGET
jgi:hypothetical protein